MRATGGGQEPELYLVWQLSLVRASGSVARGCAQLPGGGAYLDAMGDEPVLEDSHADWLGGVFGERSEIKLSARCKELYFNLRLKMT